MLVGNEYPGPGGQGLLEQPDRLGDPARVLIGGGEIALRGQGAGVIGAQQPLTGGEGLLVERDRLGDPARVLIGVGEVVPRGQRVRMVGAQQGAPGRPRVCSNNGIASATRPAAW